jgi:hypothetical protein
MYMRATVSSWSVGLAMRKAVWGGIINASFADVKQAGSSANPMCADYPTSRQKGMFLLFVAAGTLMRGSESEEGDAPECPHPPRVSFRDVVIPPILQRVPPT